MILDRVVAISRFTQDSDDADKEQYQVGEGIFIGVPMNIQPASPDETVMVDGAYGKTFSAYTTQSGIKIGDRVTVSGTGQQLRVRGVGDWSNPDLIPYYEYTLVEFEEDTIL